MTRRFSAMLRTAAIVGLVGALAAPAVEARPGGGKGSFGSRGSQTYSAPPSTATAPRTAQPMQRTEAPNVAPRPGATAGAAQAARPGLGFGGGMMAGLLGAGLLGMLFGGGFLGGLGGLASMMGLLLQVALIGGLVWLALRFFRRRQEPAMAGAAPQASVRSALGPNPAGPAAGGLAGGGMGGGAPLRQPVEIGQADYEAFERLLGEVQLAYGREDVGALTRIATPEIVRYMSSDLEADRSQGLRNEVSAPKLLQGDLAEAWREGTAEYASVAMRFSVIDVTVERTTGKVVDGDRARPVEATEIWTFRRDMRGPWLLSAIQQTA